MSKTMNHVPDASCDARDPYWMRTEIVWHLVPQGIYMATFQVWVYDSYLRDWILIGRRV